MKNNNNNKPNNDKIDRFLKNHFDSLPKVEHSAEDDQAFIENIFERASEKENLIKKVTLKHKTYGVFNSIYKIITDFFKTLFINPFSIQGASVSFALILIFFATFFYFKDSESLKTNNVIQICEKPDKVIYQNDDVPEIKESTNNIIHRTIYDDISFAPPASRNENNQYSYQDTIIALEKSYDIIKKTLSKQGIKIDKSKNDSIISNWFISASKKFNKDIKARFVFVLDRKQIKITPVLEEIQIEGNSNNSNKTAQDSFSSVLKAIKKNRFE